MMNFRTLAAGAAGALALTAAASGEIPLSMAAMAVIGTNIGTTSTAILAALSATPAARRVATAHVIFNLTAAAGALLLLSPLLWLSTWLTSGFNPGADTPAILAMFHTLFNLLGAVIMALTGSRLITFLQRRFVSAEESLARPRYLDPTLAKVPELALRGLVLEAERMREAAFAMVAGRREAGAGAAATDPGRLLPLGRAIRAFIGVDRSGSAQGPKTFAAWMRCGSTISCGGTALACAMAASRSAPGVAAQAQSVSSLVRAMPVALSQPGS